jgi:murein DD-endopeptidase MepM/ murein hydrolase activator NlpD
MKKYHISPVLILNFFFITIAYTAASAFEATVTPPEISPGDAFVVKVEKAENPGEPSATFDEKTLYFSSCGDGCFIAIGSADISAEPGVYSVLLTLGEKKTNLDIVLKQAEFPTIHLTLPEGKVFLSPEDQERANREAVTLSGIWPVITDRVWDGEFIQPLDNEVSTVFGVKRIMNKKKTSLHRGVDFRGKSGEPVRAFNRGRVVLADELFYGGNTVILDHGQGIYSIYMHLSKFNVKVNDILEKGTVVGRVGSSGRATGPHLHFGVKIRSINTNPLSFLELGL